MKFLCVMTALLLLLSRGNLLKLPSLICSLQIVLDGIDASSIALKSYRRHIGLVSQEPVLFASTIADNIGFGKDGEREIAYATCLECTTHPPGVQCAVQMCQLFFFSSCRRFYGGDHCGCSNRSNSRIYQYSS